MDWEPCCMLARRCLRTLCGVFQCRNVALFASTVCYRC